MKFQDHSYKVWGLCPSTKNEAVERIENAGRTCYRTEDKIVEGSGIVFVEGIWKRRHFSVIEHSNVVIASRFKQKFPLKSLQEARLVFSSKYFEFAIEEDTIYIAGNWRAWIEWWNVTYPNKQCSIDDFPDCLNTREFRVVQQKEIPAVLQAVTVELITDRAVTHELVRHRPASYSQESQRYVKYDGGMLFIYPSWYADASPDLKRAFEESCYEDEQKYKFFRENGLRPEQARVVLPNACATKIVVTAYIPEWKHIFSLRTSLAAYLDIRSLMISIERDFTDNGWL